MKIAINLTRDYVGGITISNLNLVGYLYTNDYSVVGIELSNRMSMNGAALFRPFAPEAFDHRIINIHHLSLEKTLKKSPTLTALKRSFRDVVNEIRLVLKETSPDIVVLSGTHYMPLLISIAARLEKIPVLLWYSGILTKETEHMSEHEHTLFRAMEKDIVSSARKIIFPSKLCKQTVEKMVVGHTIKRGIVIPNPMARIFTDPTPIPISIERKIAAVGRYSKIKNFDAFFEVHRILKKMKWNHVATFVTSKGKRPKVAPRTIEMKPSMNPEELRNFYLSQGLIMCPSEFETFGNVPMEAVCLGIPVLVSDNMGCAEVLKKAGLESMVISFDNLDVVAERVKELCGQSILPKQMNKIRKMLDIQHVSERIRVVVDKTMRSRRLENGN